MFMTYKAIGCSAEQGLVTLNVSSIADTQNGPSALSEESVRHWTSAQWNAAYRASLSGGEVQVLPKDASHHRHKGKHHCDHHHNLRHTKSLTSRVTRASQCSR